MSRMDFFVKLLTLFSHQLLSQRNSTKDNFQGPKYTCQSCRQCTSLNLSLLLIKRLQPLLSYYRSIVFKNDNMVTVIYKLIKVDLSNFELFLLRKAKRNYAPVAYLARSHCQATSLKENLALPLARKQRYFLVWTNSIVFKSNIQ